MAAVLAGAGPAAGGELNARARLRREDTLGRRKTDPLRAGIGRQDFLLCKWDGGLTAAANLRHCRTL